jgi:DNA-binding HxlR family transcriptional regulator
MPSPRRPAAPSVKDAINAALDLFHRRWTLRILWELRGPALNFRQLQSACGDLSASVLSQRLAELREALLVEHEAADGGYRLTPHGRELLTAFEPLQRWAVPWAAAVGRAKPASR